MVQKFTTNLSPTVAKISHYSPKIDKTSRKKPKNPKGRLKHPAPKGRLFHVFFPWDFADPPSRNDFPRGQTGIHRRHLLRGTAPGATGVANKVSWKIWGLIGHGYGGE